MTKHKMQYAAWAMTAALVVPLQAQTKVVATGLLNPAKIILGPSGSLLVSEFSTAPNSGRVSIISSSGVRSTLIDGLPSAVGANGPDGPTGLVLDGNTLYVAIGEGDLLMNGDAGTQVPNAKSPASPILDTILQIDLGGPVDKIAAAFTLKAADHNVLANGQPVSLDNGAGDKATLSMLSVFRVRPDPVTIYRNSHPYALVKTPEDPKHLYLSDAGLNQIVQVDLPSGRWRTLTSFPNQPNRVAGSGPPTVEAVPDSLEPFAGKLLVTLLTGFPFSTGDSKVMIVDPNTGDASVLVDNLTSSIAITSRSRFFGGVDFYVLQFSTDLLKNAPGQLLLVNGTSTKVVLDSLPGPSAMVLDRSSGRLFIATKSGQVLEYDLPN